MLKRIMSQLKKKTLSLWTVTSIEIGVEFISVMLFVKYKLQSMDSY
jgi:hypothetical protein